ncbi:serine/threonine-protein kinase [Streptomyces sp. SAJ15]|uniref:serine/threonine-protein kinase n=1 Tax=Streptomyces sp. SAJ15 TaxID=2011095 RepID=UPI00118630F5|nr:serine/threonine-protein kinase [Streptomyces sp. SAJ15]TVL91803.1 serine/threonine protein kinase [Streptomyces sp. SAJ15]
MSTPDQPCQRPECDGAYEDMGGGELYCDTCGLAPVVSSQGLVISAPTGISAFGHRGSGSTGSGPHSSSRFSTRSQSSRSSRRSVSGRLSFSRSDPSSTRSVSVRSAPSAGTSVRSRLGAGLVNVPKVPRPDPRTVVLDRPEVPERKRFCSRGDCGAPVGRSRAERPGRTEGFCTKCGHPYSFVPKLHPGDLVHGQYEVAGCLAHGGLGWIYLAMDTAVAHRWVVLKGLLDTGDEDALAAAVNERRFLAEIEHSNIVRIYNFVEHLDQRTGSLDGYIVMEYVGGKSLKEIANERRTPDGRRDPLPVEQACAYGIEALEALGHLHSRRLLYCDFKVDNAIQQQDQLKLIDMGAVRREGDENSPLYGTVGYQAPELSETGPSVASDLYTVARTLAVLTFDFQGYTNVFVDSLPDPEHIEVFRRYESFYRLLVRATDPDPERRFASAEEMADQLTGVLREVVALQSGQPRPALSTLFESELRVVDTQLFAEQSGDASRLGTRQVAATGGRGRRALPCRRPAATGGGTVPPGGTGLAAATLGTGTTGTTGSGGAGSATPGGAGAGTSGRTGAGTAGGPGPGATASGGGGSGSAASAALGTADIGADPAPAAPDPLPLLAPLDARATALALPTPRVSPADPNAGLLEGLPASSPPAEVSAALRAAPTDSTELRLRRVRAELELGEERTAAELLAGLEADHPDDWRIVWYRGLHALATGDHTTAALSFDAVYDAFPGEPATKLALGVCAEVLGQLDNAAEYYGLVWTTDPSYVSAAFGLARVRLCSGDRRGAVAALESVPASSIHYTAARVAAVRARLRQRAARDALFDDLVAASGQVERLGELGLDAVRRELLSTEVLGGALDWILAGGSGAPRDAAAHTLLGSSLNERGLRFGLERSYRTLARLAQRGEERIDMVERANRFRPRTWV